MSQIPAETLKALVKLAPGVYYHKESGAMHIGEPELLRHQGMKPGSDSSALLEKVLRDLCPDATLSVIARTKRPNP